MSTDYSDIAWTHYTFNPWSGCDEVSAGCEACYARRLPPTMRRGAAWGRDKPRIHATASYWRGPEQWDRQAGKAGSRLRVFCASTADVMEDRDDLDPARLRLWDLIRRTPNLDWLLLTKRPTKMLEWAKLNGWPENAMAGASVEDQLQAEARIPVLLEVPARTFISVEPMLGPIDLRGWIEPSSIQRVAGGLRRGLYPSAGAKRSRIGWVICGGESGRGRMVRPMHPAWPRGLRDQCKANDVPFFFKRWGEWAPRSPGDSRPFNTFASHNRDRLVAMDGTIHSTREPASLWSVPMSRVGVKASGNLLDGELHEGFPRELAHPSTPSSGKEI